MFVNQEYSGWQDECAAISKIGYIGDWSWLYKMRITGPDVIKCLEQSTINGLKKFPVGRGRHIESILPNGKMIGDAIAFREAEKQVLVTGGSMVAENLMIKKEGCDVQVENVAAEIYNFHVQGSVSKAVLEKLTNDSLDDLEFLCFRESHIANRKVRIYRGGMSGEIGYELFGNRKVLSLATIEFESAVEGNEVLILYGSKNKWQMMIRAKVVRAPYKCDNRR